MRTPMAANSSTTDGSNVGFAALALVGRLEVEGVDPGAEAPVGRRRPLPATPRCEQQIERGGGDGRPERRGVEDHERRPTSNRSPTPTKNTPDAREPESAWQRPHGSADATGVRGARWLTTRHAAGARSRLLHAVDEGRGARRRHRRARRHRPRRRTRRPRLRAASTTRACGGRRLVDAIGQTGQRDIAAISVAGQQHGMVVTDDAGTVLRPAKLWNDTESAPEAAKLVEQFGAERWADTRRSSSRWPPSPSPSWPGSSRHEPQVFARIGHVMLPHDWLTFRLTGRIVTDRGDASGTGYWSPSTGRWRPDILRRLDRSVDASPTWLERLPDRARTVASGPTGWRRRCTSSSASAAGPSSRPAPATTWRPPSASACDPGQIAISIGTSGTVFTVSDDPVADPTGAVAGFADATGRFLPLVCTSNATKVTDTVARLMGLDARELGRLALRAPAGAGGLVLLPYLDGERTPNRPDATGWLHGLRSDATREQLARAAFEGVVCSLLDGVDALAAAGVDACPTLRLQLVGGGARSAAYRQILADLSGPTGGHAQGRRARGPGGVCPGGRRAGRGALPRQRHRRLGPGRRDVDRAVRRRRRRDPRRLRRRCETPDPSGPAARDRLASRPGQNWPRCCANSADAASRPASAARTPSSREV